MCQKILFTGSFYNVLSNVHIPKHVIRFSMLWPHFATNLTLSPPFRRNIAKNGIAEHSLLRSPLYPPKGRAQDTSGPPGPSGFDP